jgi:hypothetical protein
MGVQSAERVGWVMCACIRVTPPPHASRGFSDHSSQTPPLVEEEAPFLNTKIIGENKNVVMGPDGIWNQNDCAGEG